ncbi:MAG: hypothetical protein ABGW63_00685, partial [Flavobacteriaceae bacterium]
RKGRLHLSLSNPKDHRRKNRLMWVYSEIVSTMICIFLGLEETNYISEVLSWFCCAIMCAKFDK